MDVNKIITDFLRKLIPKEKKMNISNANLKLLKTKIDIVDLISEYMELNPKKDGRLWGICPFHNDTNPSFSVSKKHQLFHCFGCGAAGDIFTFIQMIEKKKIKNRRRK